MEMGQRNVMERLFSRFVTMTPVYQSTDSGNGVRKNKQDGNVIRTEFIDFGGDNQIEVPTLSGNSFRGRMRRDLAYHLFDAVGVDVNADFANGKEGHKMTFHTFTSGGGLVKEDALKKNELQGLEDLFPVFGLFGGVMGGRWLTSHLGVCDALPASNDLRSLFADMPEDWFSDFSPEERYTKNRDYRMYRVPDRGLVELPDFVEFKGSKLKQEGNGESKNDENGEDNPEASTQTKRATKGKGKEKGKEASEEASGNTFRNMPVSNDYILRNTPFVLRFNISPAMTALEWSALGLAIQLLAANPRLGGKRQVGFGLVDWTNLPQDERLNPALYERHLQENKEQIHAMLTDPKGFVHAFVKSKK